jgi:hypothetical protein
VFEIVGMDSRLEEERVVIEVLQMRSSCSE